MAAEDDGASSLHRRLADITVRGASVLVRTIANLPEHDGVLFVSTTGCIARMIMEVRGILGRWP